MLNEDTIIEQALRRLHAGEILSGSFMHEHGLDEPIVSCSRLSFEAGVFVHKCWWEKPIVSSGEFDPQRITLDEAGVRLLLARDRPLRSALGG